MLLFNVILGCFLSVLYPIHVFAASTPLLHTSQSESHSIHHESHDDLNTSTSAHILSEELRALTGRVEALERSMVLLQKKQAPYSNKDHSTTLEKNLHYGAEKEIFNTAYDHYQQGHYAQAIDEFQHFLTTFSESSDCYHAYFWLAQAYVQLKRYDEAIVAYSSGYQHNPNGNKSVDYLVSMINLLDRMSKPKELCLMVQQLTHTHQDLSQPIEQKLAHYAKVHACHTP